VFLDFDDARPEIQSIESAISLREGVILSVAAHVLALLLILWLPTQPWFKQLTQRQAVQAAPVVVAQDSERPQPFVVVEPKIDRETLRAIDRAMLSDKNRQSQTRERPPDARNSQPFSRGNTPEFVESQPPAARPRGQGPAPEPAPPQPPATAAPQGSAPSLQAERAPAMTPPQASASSRPAPPPGGSLGDALRDLGRYSQNQQLENPSGGLGEFGPTIQFDTKGVEFGPWIRRFVAQVKRNWFVPYAAMSLRGHVVITFNVHKDGRITDLQVIKPSGIDAFNNAAHNALSSSNPTMPLPTEYPSDKAFFTVTFYYNESPGH
jgi:TonB family protein